MDYGRLYEYRFREVSQAGRDAVWAEVARYMYEVLGRPARVLDPAAGRGEFIDSVPARERWAVDRIPPADGALRDDTRFVVGDVMEVELPAAGFDAVFISNFLEHLPSQEAIASFLERVRGWVREGGVVAVMGPNYRYCSKTYWDFADHEIALTHAAVAEHLYAAGLSPTRTIPRFLPYSFRGSLPASRRLTRLYLRVPLAWRVLGRQFLVLAER